MCEDDERRFGGGFLFCVEDFVGGLGGYAEGEKLYLWERGDAGAGFLGTGGIQDGDLLDPQAGQEASDVHPM